MNLEVGVKILLHNTAEEYLFLRRAQPLPDGSGIRWDVPGGRLKAAETLEQALRREINEETGLAAESPTRLINAQDIVLPQNNRHIIRLTYAAVTSADKIQLSAEHSEYQWLPLAKVRNLLVDTYLKKTIDALLILNARV